MPALIYPLIAATCIHAGGYWCWILVPFNIALVPAVDHILKRATPDWVPREQTLRMLFSPIWFAVYALAQTVSLIYAFFSLPQFADDALALFGLASGVGIMTGTGGITAAHELMHRRSRAARCLAQFLLGSTSYMHFAAVHVRGHHRRVATPEDPGTAVLGESFTTYFGRVLVAGALSAWHLEAERLDRLRLPRFSLRNRLLWALLAQLAVLSAVAVLFGPIGLGFFLLQSFIAIHLLEAVNYVQHYGLSRGAPSVARIAPDHAWDSDYRLSELLVFNLTRHADHHVNAGKACHELTVCPDSPKLPYSFFLMVFLALIPPVWRRLMDARTAALLQPSGSPDRHYPASVDPHGVLQ